MKITKQRKYIVDVNPYELKHYGSKDEALEEDPMNYSKYDYIPGVFYCLTNHQGDYLIKYNYRIV